MTSVETGSASQLTPFRRIRTRLDSRYTIISAHIQHATDNLQLKSAKHVDCRTANDQFDIVHSTTQAVIDGAAILRSAVAASLCCRSGQSREFRTASQCEPSTDGWFAHSVPRFYRAPLLRDAQLQSCLLPVEVSFATGKVAVVLPYSVSPHCQRASHHSFKSAPKRCRCVRRGDTAICI